MGISTLENNGTGGNDSANTNGDSKTLVDVPSGKHTVECLADFNKPASVTYTNATGGDTEENFTGS